MKYTNLPSFEKHLEGAAPAHFSDVYLIMAKEPFLRKQAVERLIALVLQKEANPAFALRLFDGEKHGADEIIQELKSMALFAKKRVIVVHNVDELEKSATQKLEMYCSTPNRAVCFVVTASSLNRATTFYKKLEKVGVILDVAEEKPWEREKWVGEWLVAAAKQEGKQLSLQAAQLLIKQMGTDQMLLSSELAKLVCYVGERKGIQEEDIAAISLRINLSNGWLLGEAIFRREAATALAISKSLLAEGTAVIALLRQIRSQFQTQFQICSILAAGGSAGDVSQEYAYMKGAILERNIRQSQAYGMSRFKQGILAIDEAELQAKNSGVDPEFLIEKLIITLTI